MAEEDPEIALLKAGQENIWENDGANEAVESEQPSNTEDNNEVKKPVADDQVQRALSPSGSGVVPDTLTVPIADEEQSRSSSRASTRRPRVIGGFFADDSDEEEEAASTPAQEGANALQVSDIPNRIISPSPLQNVTNSEETGTFPASALSVNMQTSVPVPTPTTVQSVSVPKPRLPHDRMGILEDKVRDDPKGDIEAWLSLISEYRSRHKLEEARETYERFFKVFPQAVSILRLSQLWQLMSHRPKYGLRMQRWKSRAIISAPRNRSSRSPY